MRRDVNSSHRHVRRQDRMYFPHRGVDDADTFNEDIATPIWLDERRSQITAVTNNPLSCGNSVLRILKQFRSRCELIRLALLPSEIRIALPRPPMFVVCLAVESATTSNRNILAFERVNERRI